MLSAGAVLLARVLLAAVLALPWPAVSGGVAHAETPAARGPELALVGADSAAGVGAADAELQLALIEALYRDQQSYHAESEIRRFLTQYPHHARRTEVVLARAKLYYRVGRYADSAEMLVALLHSAAGVPGAGVPGAGPMADARRLLVFAQVRLERLEDARGTAAGLPADPSVPAGASEPAGARAGFSAADFAELEAALPAAPDLENARRWARVLPGSGYSFSDQHAKGAGALSANLLLTGAAVSVAQTGNVAGAGALLVGEVLLFLYVYQDSLADARSLSRRLRMRQINRWVARRGELQLLVSAWAGG